RTPHHPALLRGDGVRVPVTRTRLPRTTPSRCSRLPVPVQGQGARGDAVALAGGPGAVAEDMAQMPTAPAAAHLGPGDEHLPVPGRLNGIGGGGLEEAGPAGAGVELGLGSEQRRPAAGAAVG